MLGRKNRLNQAICGQIMKAGKYAPPSLLFTLRYIYSADSPRFSVVAPKKTAKLAVHRNSNRRRVYAALRAHMNEASVPPILGMFILRSDLTHTPVPAIQREIAEILAKIPR